MNDTIKAPECVTIELSTDESGLIYDFAYQHRNALKEDQINGEFQGEIDHCNTIMAKFINAHNSDAKPVTELNAEQIRANQNPMFATHKSIEAIATLYNVTGQDLAVLMMAYNTALEMLATTLEAK